MVVIFEEGWGIAVLLVLAEHLPGLLVASLADRADLGLRQVSLLSGLFFEVGIEWLATCLPWLISFPLHQIFAEMVKAIHVCLRRLQCSCQFLASFHLRRSHSLREALRILPFLLLLVPKLMIEQCFGIERLKIDSKTVVNHVLNPGCVVLNAVDAHERCLLLHISVPLTQVEGVSILSCLVRYSRLVQASFLELGVLRAFHKRSIESCDNRPTRQVE